MSERYVYPTKLSREINFYGTPLDTGGLTLREYYAGLAMQAIVASPHPMPESDNGRSSRNRVATASVKLADALIKALDGEP